MTPRPAPVVATRRRAVRAALVGLLSCGVLVAPGVAPAVGSTADVVAPPAGAELTTEAARTVTVLSDDGEGGLDVQVVETDSAAAARALVAREQRDPDTVVASVAVPVRAVAPDPLRSSQWALTDLRAETAWTSSTGVGQVVAVLDTGVDASHPDLAGVVLPGRSTTGNGRDGRVDVDGHGTHVAGVVAAVAGNGIGVAGLAPDAKVLPVQVLDDTGGGLSSWVSAGIIWAADNGAHVINLSLGGPQPDPALETAISYARSKGSVVVAASGNESATSVSYPAAYPGVLAVGATNSSRAVPSFSNRGTALDVVAPGAGIRSTVPGGTYATWSGTSMATPYAAAAAALLRAQQPGLSEAQVRSRLERTAVDLGSPCWDRTSGNGLVNPVAALSTVPTDTTPPGQAALGTTTVGLGTVRLRWTPPADTDLAGVIVVRASGIRTITSPDDGTVVYTGTGTDVVMTGLDVRSAHSFAVFARDRACNLSRPRLVQLQGLRLSAPTTTVAGAAATAATHGQSVVVRSTVQDHTAKATQGFPLTFQARPVGAGTWSTIGRVTVQGGEASLVHKPSRTMEYRVMYPGASGSPGRIGAASAAKRLDVRMAVTVSTSATTVRRGTSVAVSGSVSPVHAGKLVRLERKTSTGWSKTAEQKLSSTSTYRFSVSRSTTGSVTYRVVSPADGDHATGTSTSRTISWT